MPAIVASWQTIPRASRASAKIEVGHHNPCLQATSCPCLSLLKEAVGVMGRKGLRDSASCFTWWIVCIFLAWIGEKRDGNIEDPIERQGLSIQSDDDIYQQAVDTIPGIGFLGSGYDMVMGNPLGDEHSPGDPGFRAPVIAFDWGHDREGVSSDLTTLQPKGAFIRPYVSCQKAENVEEIESLKDYVTDLAADASTDVSVPFLPFSGSFNFRLLADESQRKQTKTFMMRAYCFRYEAGLALVSDSSSTLTDPFRKAIENLPSAFPSTAEGSNCTPDVFKKNRQSPACADHSIMRWMEFFNDFGTHVTTNIKLGGKVTKQLRVSKEQAEALNNRALKGSGSAETALKTILTADASAYRDSSNKDTNTSLVTSSMTHAVGGRPPKDPTNPQELSDWAKSVAVLPMPVQYQLQPLTRVLPEHLHPAYSNAVFFYSRVFGISKEELQVLAGSQRSIKETLRESTTVTWAGPAPGFVDCPRGKQILFGFAALLNMDNAGAAFDIKACQIGNHRCEGPNAKHTAQSDMRIWAVCGEKAIDSLETFSSVDPKPDTTVGCSQGKEILFGMQMSFLYNRNGLSTIFVSHCSSGAKECRFEDTATADQIRAHHLFFAACANGDLPDLHNLFTASSVGRVGTSQSVNTATTAATDCGANASHVTGFAMELHTFMPLVRDAFNSCKVGSRYCALKKFVVPPPVAIENLWGKTAKVLRHSTVAFAICALKDATSASGE
ncbi:uncharacterized protein LOC113146615 [Cyclospora cayetanensis]|uniref:Uncharacterized protein LOC113146615 n=1 Tax=Cyclospora cayetanensis TaxID=88456 RepID=A0A6P6RT79_9EIME|nr:uncharacterized protein LOC113146615 [Cyclospora cayetanensis]